ncbi:hypothetical protein GQ44DRAFT_733253 [Phaeosphaeriaceae sp. PMI808]|nr:hypothetical protein GQ44DRAFT_733253 [Phaeosphaeriaceae sp. PMI808]
MPRRKSEIPPALRIRENQRRSRGRKKALIEELQSRLHDCGKEQLQATILVQHAARKVAWENAQLRHLLAKFDVDEQYITNFLRSQSLVDPLRRLNTVKTGPQTFLSPISGNSDAQPKTLTCAQDFSPIQLPTPPPSSQFEAASTVQHDSSSTSQNRPAVTPELLLSSDSNNISRESYYSNAYPSLNSISLDQSPLPPISDCFCPEFAQDQSAQGGMGSMSCEAAASIIAGMRGHGDDELVLQELGCEQGMNCEIGTIQVLQIMGVD